MKKPTKVNILGSEYSITYFEYSTDVDPSKREATWGSIDYLTREIKIFNKLKTENIFQTLLHEIFHGIAHDLHLKINNDENELDLLALGFSDVLSRNKWITFENDDTGE